MLKFSKANAKTEALKQVDELKPYLEGKQKIYSLDLLSGYSCPFAEKCLSKATVDKATGKRKIKDGPYTEFRCFSASQEVQYTNVYNSRKHNYDMLKGASSQLEMNRMLYDALPSDAGIVRIHVAGDFFSRDYMLAWMTLAELNPNTLFYAYTKSLKYWLEMEDYYHSLSNFVLTASYGGRDDYLIETENLRFAKVVFSEAEADKLGLEIDHDDSHAARPSLKNQSFALLLHGTQPKGTDAATALKALKGVGSYSRKKLTTG